MRATPATQHLYTKVFQTHESRLSSLCRTLAAGASLCLFSAGLALADPPRRVFAWVANDPTNCTCDNATLAGIREVMTPTDAAVKPYFAGFNWHHATGPVPGGAGAA